MKRVVKVYRGEKAHQAGIRKMMHKGWAVADTVTSVPRRGCLGFVLLGLFRRKTEFVVTFAR